MYTDNRRSSLFTDAHQSKICNTLSSIMKEKMNAFISIPEVRTSIRKHTSDGIDLNSCYSLKLTPDQEIKLARGSLHFMKSSASGLPTGQLVDKKGKIRGNVTFEKSTVPEKKPDKNMNKLHKQNEILFGQMKQIQMQNAAIMQQLMKITETVNDIRSRVIALEEMHENDLIGNIIAARDLLLQIKDTRDAELQKLLIANEISNLNHTRGMIQQEMIWSMEQIPNMPRNSFGMYLRIARDRDFCSNVSEKYNRIQKLFHLYLTTTLLLGYAYAFVNEPKAYVDIFTPDPELSNSVNLTKLINAERLFVSSPEDSWFKNPDAYLGRLSNEAQRIFANDTSIEFQITGIQLQEVLTDAAEFE